jgi:hypothetical protein
LGGRHITKTGKKKKKRHPTEKTKMRSNTDPPKTPDLLLKPFTVDSVNISFQK